MNKLNYTTKAELDAEPINVGIARTPKSQMRRRVIHERHTLKPKEFQVNTIVYYVDGTTGEPIIEGNIKPYEVIIELNNRRVIDLDELNNNSNYVTYDADAKNLPANIIGEADYYEDLFLKNKSVNVKGIIIDIINRADANGTFNVVK